MKKPTTRLSTIALLAAVLTTAPAAALSLNLGNDGPLVDLSNDSNAGATVSLDTGDVLDQGNDGGDGADALVDIDLGSSSSGTGSSGGLILDLGNDGGDLLDLDGDGNLLDLGGDGDLIDLAGIGGDGGLLTFGDGPLLDLSGNEDVDALVEIDLNGDGDLLDLTSTGSILDLGDSGDLLDLGGSGNLLDLGTDGELLDLGEGNLLDLNGADGELLALNLLDTDITATTNLDGGSEPILDVDISTDEDGVAGTGVLPSTDGEVTVGGGNAATVTLDSNADTGGGGGGDDNGGGGNGNGGNGGNGNGGNGNGAGDGQGGATSNGNGSTVAGVGLPGAAGDRCLTLNEAQLAELLKRHAYNRDTFNGWASTRSLKIVEVELCDREVAEVETAVGGDANIARLQAFLAGQAKVRAGLQSKGHSTGDVIAADHSGEVLIVYVI